MIEGLKERFARPPAGGGRGEVVWTLSGGLSRINSVFFLWVFNVNLMNYPLLFEGRVYNANLNKLFSSSDFKTLLHIIHACMSIFQYSEHQLPIKKKRRKKSIIKTAQTPGGLKVLYLKLSSTYRKPVTG